MEVPAYGQPTDICHRHPGVSVVYIGHQRLRDLPGRLPAVRAGCFLIKDFTDRPQHDLQCCQPGPLGAVTGPGDEEPWPSCILGPSRAVLNQSLRWMSTFVLLFLASGGV